MIVLALFLLIIAIIFIRVAIGITRFFFRLIFWLIDAALWLIFIGIIISIL